MDMSGDEDMFAISDEETSLSTQTASSNPVEEHLLKQLADVQNRIDATSNEIEEVKTATAQILNALQWRALHGEDINSDCDGDLYTVEGQPILKKKRQRESSNAERIVEIISQWQCILQDKWIIGVELQNVSCCTLLNLRYYPYVRGKMEIYGESMFWTRFFHWERISSIHPGAVHVVATMVLDLPTFDTESVSECWATISYEIGETQFQIPIPAVQLTIDEVIDCSCMKILNENERNAILALKSTSSTEKIVHVRLSKDNQNDEDDSCALYEPRKKQLFHFLTTKNFVKISDDVFLVKEHGPLMYCLIELEWLGKVDEVNVRIFARSVNQLNIILHFLRAVFPSMTVMEEVDDCIEAAMALIRELEMIRDKKSILDIQEAKVITDLLIP
ncbi:uncharacterized protein LOC126850316 isoform X2 [Cataglyphis hispanica]|uniref:uncharacterized protein LOC126850316 isoform X2 n=1 Tax=Cataglyphis hispanica TaxID=1086592 RepID=UPI00217F2552|nr:uncharacterized protein LOC126850316 isoform X2 [Cataglyphis hispanica]